MLSIGVAAAPQAAQAQAQAQRHRFAIPAGTAEAALRLFAEQSGRQLVFPYDAISGRRTKGYQGVFEDRAILQRIAKEANLVLVSEHGDTFVLTRAPLSEKPFHASRKAPAAPPRRTVAPAKKTPLSPIETSEVIVTASKRAQAAFDVPLSISVLDGAELRTLGLQSAADLQDVVPGVSVNTVQHGIAVTIRGVTTTDVTSKGEQGISFNVDGVFVGRPIEQSQAFFDIERIEVLRGPQGTLYGKSSTGGAINVITRKPVNRWEGYAVLEAGNFTARRAEAALNIPVTDWLAVRGAGVVNSHAGYLSPHDGSPRKSSASDQAGRVTLLAKPAPNLSARLTVTAGHIGGSGTGYANLGNFLNGDTSRERRTVYPSAFPAGLDHRFVNVDAQVDARLGPVNITYLGARQHFIGDERTSNNNDPNDPFPASTPIDPATQVYGKFRTRITSDLHELRLSNQDGDRIDYVVGATYHHEHIYENDHNFVAPRGDPDPAQSYNATDIIATTLHRSYGLFGQVDLHLDERVGVVAGLRYSQDSVRRDGFSAFGRYGADGAACYGPADCIGNPIPGRQSASKFTYRLGVNFKPRANALFYGSIATGYKAGGFNDADTAATSPTFYAPEQLTAYEVGMKLRTGGGVGLQSSAFYYDYAKTQINGVVVLNGAAILNTRIVPTRVWGWESQLDWQVSPHTSVALSVAFEESRYDRFMAGVFQNIDWTGLSLDRTPAFVGMATLGRTWDLPGGATLQARAFTKVSAAYYLSDFTSGLRFRQQAFTRSDASLRYSAAGDRWYLQAFVQNIENGLQATSPPQNFDPRYLNASYLYITDPRTFGLRFGINWR